jgi:hypothetical protein
LALLETILHSNCADGNVLAATPNCEVARPSCNVPQIGVIKVALKRERTPRAGGPARRMPNGSGGPGAPLMSACSPFGGGEYIFRCVEAVREFTAEVQYLTVGTWQVVPEAVRWDPRELPLQ